MDTPRYQGGFAEVWKTEHEGREVAVKVLKVYVKSDLVKIMRVCSLVFQITRVGQLTSAM